MSTLSAPVPTSTDRRWHFALGAWLALAVLASALGLLTPERLPLVPLSIAGGTLALVIAYRRVPSFRAFAQRIDLRVPILLHFVRLPIGVAFLVMASRGALDPTFATIAGYGDILAGGLALVAAAMPSRTGIVRAWNVIGLADILLVVATAQRILFFSGHPETMSTMAAFPWSTIPTFVVPLVIATHLLVLARLSATRRP
ncbi:hypothetical protein [Sandaracinus amylolyticus]|uniref:Uncharacterized protein n=1 Tax=Sandaracinus amylolyticus TaxID=927083 RepID=A0A0F6YMG9_9BACT|nr:hypothetical protein [Sandaracinus amylolyticus]AKF09253.1 Hypothetical protein DB32_006402 [Sandaracinus amylolyticus]